MREERLLAPDALPDLDAVRLPPLWEPPELERLLEPLPDVEAAVFFCVEAIGKILLFYGAAGASMGRMRLAARETAPAIQQ